MAKVLVIAAHPDDEVLGCGGTIAKHILEGDEVQILIVAEGLTSRGVASPEALLALKQMTIAANEILGVSKTHFLDCPDNMMDSRPMLETIKKIEEILEVVKPRIIYTHHNSDLNIDHQIVCEAVITAARPLPGSLVKEIYFFETLSATHWGSRSRQFNPNYFQNISSTLNKKVMALGVYGPEMREFPHARSLKAVEALAEFRGAMIGVKAAEAFEVFRILKD